MTPVAHIMFTSYFAQHTLEIIEVGFCESLSANMKYFFAAALLALPLALATSLKSVVITFPKGTPDSVITQAKDSLVASVRSAPGHIVSSHH